MGNYRVQRLFYGPPEVIAGVVVFLWHSVVYSVSVGTQLYEYYEFNRPLILHVLAVFGLVQRGESCVSHCQQV